MASYKNLKFESADGVARLTLARPKHNVLNIEMMREMTSLLEELLRDRELKCLVVLGEGASWCAGVDVGEHKPEMAPEMIRTFNRIFELLDRLEVPTIAAVHGACLGGGLEVAIACDIVFAGKGATFGQPEIKLGFLPPYAAVRLPQLIGPAKAIEVCTTGRRYSADAAQKLGMVSQVVEDQAFAAELAKLVDEIKACSPLILRLNKRAVKQHLGMAPDQAIDSVSTLFLEGLMKTEDTQEGIASFFEKRPPKWKNR
jgi:cyclohexa-1,5-dienecarbonyl-CoA hydratase